MVEIGSLSFESAAEGYLFPREKSPSREGELMAYSVWLKMGQGAYGVWPMADSVWQEKDGSG